MTSDWSGVTVSPSARCIAIDWLLSNLTFFIWSQYRACPERFRAGMLWIRPKAWKMKFKEDRPLATPEAAEQLIGADRGGHERRERSGERTRRGLTGHRSGVGRGRCGRQRNWRGARSQQTGNLAFDIV